jgi:hypothetical protein
LRSEDEQSREIAQFDGKFPPVYIFGALLACLFCNSAAVGAASDRKPDGFLRSEQVHAPLVRKGSKLRLALPEQRQPARLANPQTDRDRLHGLIMAYREGDIPVALAYLQEHAAEHSERIIDRLEVWAAEARHPDRQREARMAIRRDSRTRAPSGLRLRRRIESGNWHEWLYHAWLYHALRSGQTAELKQKTPP